jgi:hypothetical protein
VSCPSSRDLVTLALRCALCDARPVLTLPAEQDLAHVYCPSCDREGGLAMARTIARPPPPEPTRVSKYGEPPDMEGDEYLRARRQGYWP